MELSGRIAITTGGSRGIGRAICVSLAKAGCTVIACARDEGKLQALADEVVASGLPGKIVPQTLDVTDGEAVEGMVESVADEFGRIDILVNNAGITRDSLIMSMEDEAFDTVIETNLRSVFLLCRAVSRHMVRARWGRIINISSVSGIMGNKGQCNYAASKAGVIGLTKSLAKELAKRKVTCNVVAPGFIETDMTGVLPEIYKDEARAVIPMQRFGTGEDIAGAVRFLASEEAAYITGQVLAVDGGLSM